MHTATALGFGHVCLRFVERLLHSLASQQGMNPVVAGRISYHVAPQRNTEVIPRAVCSCSYMHLAKVVACTSSSRYSPPTWEGANSTAGTTKRLGEGQKQRCYRRVADATAVTHRDHVRYSCVREHLADTFAEARGHNYHAQSATESSYSCLQFRQGHEVSTPRLILQQQPTLGCGRRFRAV